MRLTDEEYRALKGRVTGSVVGTRYTGLKTAAVSEGAGEKLRATNRTRSPRQSVVTLGEEVSCRRGLVPQVTAKSLAGSGCSQAGSNPAPSPPSPYKSTWEARYAQHLDVLKAAGEIAGWWYEPVRFRLPGKRNFYKADFLVQARCKQAHGSMAGQHAGIEIHEVKGWSKNRREGITKLKTAAGLNQWAIFRMIEWDRKTRQWTERVID